MKKLLVQEHIGKDTICLVHHQLWLPEFLLQPGFTVSEFVQGVPGYPGSSTAGRDLRCAGEERVQIIGLQLSCLGTKAYHAMSFKEMNMQWLYRWISFNIMAYHISFISHSYLIHISFISHIIQSYNIMRHRFQVYLVCFRLWVKHSCTCLDILQLVATSDKLPESWFM